MLTHLALALALRASSPPPAWMSYPGGPRSVGTVGDVDGDGHSDLIVGVVTRREKKGRHPGGAYLFSGKDGRLLCEVGPPDSALCFGMSVCGFADLDRDGARDFAVGAPGMAVGKSLDAGPGAVLVYSSRTGKLLLRIGGKKAGDKLGYEVARAGDVDRDGTEDIVAGAPGANAAFVFSGKDGRVLLELRSSEGDAKRLGASVTGIGDVDGDAVPDLAAGAFEPGGSSGSVVVFSGREGHVLRTLTLSECASYRSSGSVDGCRFGVSIDGAGDKDADGVLDLLVGSDQAGDGMEGRAFVLSGKDGRRLCELRGTAEVFSRFGTSVASVEDLDADGATDWIVADSDDDLDPERQRGQAPGSVQAFSGKDGRRVWQVFGEASHDHFGYAVAAAGDVDGDRVPDVIARNDPGAKVPYVRVHSGKDGKVIHTILVPFDVLPTPRGKPAK